MTYLALALVALWIGYVVGQQPHWATWHGPVGAVLVVPLAMFVGLDPVLSVVAPVCLGIGFLACRVIERGVN